MYNTDESPMKKAMEQILAETQSVSKGGRNLVVGNIETTLHTAEKDFKMNKTVSYDCIRDYYNHACEVVYISCIVGLGDYVRHIYPYKENLECTVKIIPVDTATGETNAGEDIIARRYKALFNADENPKVDGADYQGLDVFHLNTTSIVTVKFQLMDRASESLRTLKCGGCYQETTNGNIIYNVISNTSGGMEAEGELVLDAVEIVQPDNEEEKDQVVVPEGTLLTNLPTYLQENEGGVYNSQCGNFLQYYNGRVTWFVYPMGNNLRFEGEDNSESDKCKAVIYSIPSIQNFGINKTYAMDGDVLKILAVQGKSTFNDAETKMSDKGNGFMQQDADSIMTKNVKITKDGPVAKPSMTTSNVASQEKGDGLDFTQVSDERVSSNVMVQTGKQILKQGSLVYVEWPHGDLELLYPAMPIKYIFINNVEGNIQRVEVCGTLLKAQSTIQPNEKGWSSRFMISVIGLGLFVDKVSREDLGFDEYAAEEDKLMEGAGEGLLEKIADAAGLGDVVDTVKGAVNTVKTAVDTVKSAVNTVTSTVNAVKQIGNDIGSLYDSIKGG